MSVGSDGTDTQGRQMSQVVTGEAVAIDLRVARLGSRMIAAFIDLIIQGYVLYAVVTGAFLVVQPDDEALAAALFLLVYVGVVVGYPVACETFSRGRTVGKMVMGLRVVRDDGGPIRFRHAFTRGLIGAVAERPGILLGLPAVISMLVSRRSKRLGDLFAGTVVLQASVPRTMGLAPVVPPQLAGWVELLDLPRLDDDLALRARHFLGRTRELSDEAREQLGVSLVNEVRAVVTPPPPPGTPGWAYLSAVLAERSRRAYNRLTAGRLPPIPPGWPVPTVPTVPQAPYQPAPYQPAAAVAAPQPPTAPANTPPAPFRWGAPVPPAPPAPPPPPAPPGPSGTAQPPYSGQPPQPANPPAPSAPPNPAGPPGPGSHPN